MGDRVRAVRGAIVVPEDTPEAVRTATERLLGELLERNALRHDDLISIVFTATADLRSAFPAEAARRMGLGDVPLLCAREIDVPGALARVIRVLAHAETDRPRLAPAYLDGAEVLRDDLA
ncbi:MAG: chorismate mutase [Actinomycetota bacterium]